MKLQMMKIKLMLFFTIIVIKFLLMFFKREEKENKITNKVLQKLCGLKTVLVLRLLHVLSVASEIILFLNKASNSSY